MFKRNKILLAVTSASLLTVSAASQAQETVTSQATVTVQNAFVLTEVTPLSFGTIRAAAQADGANVASITVNADGTPSANDSDNNAAITIISPGARGEYSVSGTAPFSGLTITFEAADVALTNATAPPGTPDFEILLGGWEAVIIGGGNDGTAYANAGDLQTDVNGDVGFYVGGELATDSDASTSPYIDGAYVGNYVVEVSY